MSKNIKVKIEGSQDDLINLIDSLPLEGIKKIKVLNPKNLKKQKRVLKLKASVFEEMFKTKERCSE
ncbi:hypothetical protein E9993_14790 [Labilibacter sediminis]|nr:hypothetical protein E9993_14790 [Labilibacter sediminis]